MKPEPPENAARGALENLTIRLVLVGLARAARRPGVLACLMINESSRVLPYRTAVHWTMKGGKVRVKAISGVSEVERTAPYVQWLEKAVAKWAEAADGRTVFEVGGEDLPGKLRRGADDWVQGSGLMFGF